MVLKKRERERKKKRKKKQRKKQQQPRNVVIKHSRPVTGQKGEKKTDRQGDVEKDPKRRQKRFMTNYE